MISANCICLSNNRAKKSRMKGPFPGRRHERKRSALHPLKMQLKRPGLLLSPF